MELIECNQTVLSTFSSSLPLNISQIDDGEDEGQYREEEDPASWEDGELGEVRETYNSGDIDMY